MCNFGWRGCFLYFRVIFLFDFRIFSLLILVIWGVNTQGAVRYLYGFFIVFRVWMHRGWLGSYMDFHCFSCVNTSGVVRYLYRFSLLFVCECLGGGLVVIWTSIVFRVWIPGGWLGIYRFSWVFVCECLGGG
jgi:hypothetical protein